MSSPITLITSHSLDGNQSETDQEAQRRFSDFVSSNQPQLLDFQAYVSEDKRQLKLMFVFPGDDDRVETAAPSEARDQRFLDSGLAGLVTGVLIVALMLAAAYVGGFDPAAVG